MTAATLAPSSAPPALTAFLDEVRVLVDADLARRLAPPADDHGRLVEAMCYAATGPGKRLRPAVVIAAAEACGGARDAALPAAVAVEMLHAYTLVHDDLPAMDDDDERRGRPTVHVAFGEAIAILAGDGLLTEAFATLAELGPRAGAAVQVLARRAGARELLGGQAIDLAYQHKVGGAPSGLAYQHKVGGAPSGLAYQHKVGGAPSGLAYQHKVGGAPSGLADQHQVGGAPSGLADQHQVGGAPSGLATKPADLAAIERLHAAKTGALFAASAELGAIAAGADAATCAALGRYGMAIGIAFQHVDDRDDHELVEFAAAAAERIRVLGDEARAIAETFGPRGERLAAIARWFAASG